MVQVLCMFYAFVCLVAYPAFIINFVIIIVYFYLYVEYLPLCT